MPANLKLGAFQQLIGDSGGRLTQASPIDDMVARIIGPHVVEAPNPDAAAMLTAVDDALSSAMRLILHHPEFQSVEALWRSLDFLARRIETDTKLTIDLYDVSAEELAVDLAAGDDLSESGLLKLLADRPLGEEGPGGYSALFGLYTFEETPPHAELLARVAQVAAHVDAPFFTAINEEARFHAFGAALAQDNVEQVRDALLEALAEEESIRVQIRVLGELSELGWVVPETLEMPEGWFRDKAGKARKSTK